MMKQPFKHPSRPDWSARWIAAACLLSVAVLIVVLAYINRHPAAPESSAAASAPQAMPPMPEGLLSGEFDPSQYDGIFTVLPEGYADKTIYVRRSTGEALVRMSDAARQDGVPLRVVSGFRSHKHQKSIWERKWAEFSGSRREKTVQVLQYSSFPGTSRHHWGSDVDFNSVNPDYWLSAEGMKTHLWLRKNAARFGFCEPYSGDRHQGYANEPWHWSYLADAQDINQAADPAHLNKLLQSEISGADTLTAADLQPYVSEIATECLRP